MTTRRTILISISILIATVIFLTSKHAMNRHLPLRQVVSSAQEKQTDPDPGLSALRSAKIIYPHLDVLSYSAKLDHIADEVRKLAHGTVDPDRRIRCLNTVIFLQEKFSADRDAAFERRPESYFLNHLLDTKKGNCFSMPLLYVAIGQRLGWPIYMVHVPDHSFVRYVDPKLKEQNIETTSGGGYVLDEQYIRDFRVSETGIKTGAYLRTLSYKELQADFLNINAITLGQQGQLDQALKNLKQATDLNPTLVDAWANLAAANRLLAKRSTSTAADHYLVLARNDTDKLRQLGFVHPKDIP